MRKALADLIEYSFVCIELVAVEQAVLFEDDAVVNAIQPARSRDEILPGLSFFVEVFDQRIRFDQLVFKKAHEDQSIERALRNLSQRCAVEFGILSFVSAR